MSPHQVAIEKEAPLSSGEYMTDQRTGTIRTDTGVLILLLAIAGQYIVTNWVVRYSADTSLTVAVSFAGTIVSIVLALLAIVYSYYQGFAQQRDAVTLSSQIALLKDTVQSVNAATEGLARDLGHFSDISEKVDRSISVGEESRASSEAVRTQLSDLSTKLENAASRPTTSPPSADVTKQVARNLASFADSQQRAMYVALKQGSQRHLTFDQVFQNHVKRALEKKGFGSVTEQIHGFYNGLWYTLLDLRLLTVDLTGTSRIGSMSPVFVSELERVIAAKPREDREAILDVASVEETFQPPPSTQETAGTQPSK